MKRHLAVVVILIMTSGCAEPPAQQSQTTAPAVTSAKPADEPAAIRVIGEINKAQAGYIQRNRRYALTYDELVESHFLAKEPSKDATGYEISLRPSADAVSYRVLASPVSPSPSVRHFYSDKTGVIRAETGKEATVASPEI